MIKTSKLYFSCFRLTFSMIWLLLRVLDEFHFHLKWYQSKWTRGTQPLSCPALFNLKSDREELQGKASRKSDIGEIVFLISAILMVKKYMDENLKHTVKKHLAKKIKKYSHFQTITTNNSKHFFTFHIKQYWHFHWVTPKQYYTFLQTSNNTDTFRELLVNSSTRFSRVYMVSDPLPPPALPPHPPSL